MSSGKPRGLWKGRPGEAAGMIRALGPATPRPMASRRLRVHRQIYPADSYSRTVLSQAICRHAASTRQEPPCRRHSLRLISLLSPLPPDPPLLLALLPPRSALPRPPPAREPRSSVRSAGRRRSRVDPSPPSRTPPSRLLASLLPPPSPTRLPPEQEQHGPVWRRSFPLYASPAGRRRSAADPDPDSRPRAPAQRLVCARTAEAREGSNAFKEAAADLELLGQRLAGAGAASTGGFGRRALVGLCLRGVPR
ncbi:uncharacterized protein A4U43_C08F7520 [Asparagus officinalis]|nr:uncharacterized protein A4U43_C08F7520 [Asparagus officinalis]